MRTQLITVAAVIMLCALSDAAAQTRAGQTVVSTGSAEGEQASTTETHVLSPGLVGVWRSAGNETELTSDLQRSVWGANAKSVRDVELSVAATGESTLRVTTKIVDARGRSLPASTSIEEATLVVGGPRATTVAVRTEHEVKVVRAERRYPDDPNYKWPLDGQRVTLTTIEGQANSLEIRVDTPEGRGSFWETLTRARRSPTRR